MIRQRRNSWRRGSLEAGALGALPGESGRRGTEQLQKRR